PKHRQRRLPCTLAAKVPVEAPAPDRIDMPLAVANNTNESRSVALTLGRHHGLALEKAPPAARFAVPADGRSRQVFSFRPTLARGLAALSFEGRTEPFAADSIEEKFRVVPDGFPVSGSSSDLLERSATHKVTLPNWLPGTLNVQVDVYPSTLADLQKGLEGLLREPYGCFEQSSTANYPNVLILDYLKA